ncbi:DJ-1/PfpI family protein [Bradyrhizobium tropiciagri]|uniref:DJ-1/PfpI family protein n=1 Tax=Bradyrhizobium tropiciagri TaxID=312253 RepID=UPI000A67BAA2|nr:DJ-1/PfpI family protein [Bradyrhizobium tropiciagri]
MRLFTLVTIVALATAPAMLATASYAQGQLPEAPSKAGVDGKAAQSPVDEPASSMRMRAEPAKPKTKKLGIIIFPGFETLDVFGPVQMWGRLPDYEVVMVSEHGGSVRSAQGIETVAAYSFANAPQFEIIMIPGGIGTRREVDNPAMLQFLQQQDRGTEWTTSVCTGSAVLAKAGILNGRNATSNKMGWKFATSQSSDVHWQGHARWVVDGKYVTSSGVSAGTDMALGLVEKLYGRSAAERAARGAEYSWNDDSTKDPFAIELRHVAREPAER